MADIAEPKKAEPWWSRLIPDIRGIVIFGQFVLAFRLLYMIEGNPRLLDNSAFMTLATLVLGSGGLGIVITYLFGGTKTGSEVMAAQSRAVINTPPPIVIDPAPANPPAHFMEKPVQ